MLLVRDIVAAFAQDIDGAGIVMDCANPEGRRRAFELYNEITRLLMLEVPVETTMTLPVYHNKITLDRRIETVIAARVCEGKMPVRSRGFRYQDNGPMRVPFEGSLHQLEDLGDGFPTHQDLPGPLSIMAYSDQVEAADAILRINAKAAPTNKEVHYNLPIVRGTALADPPKYLGFDNGLPFLFDKIISLSKTRTNGYVYVWGYDPLELSLSWLTTMAPDETNASYRRYMVHDCSCSCESAIDARVLLRWIPLYSDDDVSLVQQPDAYKRMARGLNALMGDNHRDFEIWKNRAVSVLNKSLERKQQGQQRVPTIAVRHSGARIRNRPAVYL